MSGPMLRRMLRVLVLSLGVLVPAATAAGQEPSQGAAYIERGHQTEARQKAYHSRIDRFYEALSEAVRQAAPDLRPEIAPPPPDVHGYQILPEIGADGPAPAPGTTSEVVRFNWNATDTWIERQMSVLEGLERTLRTLPRCVRRAVAPRTHLSQRTTRRLSVGVGGLTRISRTTGSGRRELPTIGRCSTI